MRTARSHNHGRNGAQTASAAFASGAPPLAVPPHPPPTPTAHSESGGSEVGVHGSMDAEGARQWRLLRASLLVDQLGRVQQLREMSEERTDGHPLSARSGDSDVGRHPSASDAHRRRLEEEWRQATEDALLTRISRTVPFRCPPPRNQTDATASSLLRWARAAEKRNQPAPPISDVFVAAGTAGLGSRAEHSCALATLEVLQAPPAVSGIGEEMERALQLSLAQMSFRVELGLAQAPLRSEPRAPGSRPPHPFLRLLDAMEERRRGAGGCGGSPTHNKGPLPVSLLAQLRRQYCAAVIQRAYRDALRRRSARRARRAQLDERERVREAARHESEMHCVRVLQASIRARIAVVQLQRSQAREQQLVAAALRIARWYRWRSRLRRWDLVWRATAPTRSLLYQRLEAHQLSSIIRIQAFIRGSLCRRRQLPMVRAVYAHREGRRVARAWATRRAVEQRAAPVEEALVLAGLYASRECAASLAADDRDGAQVRHQFGVWSGKMYRHFLERRPLPRHWLPQRDRHSDRTYYFNLNTGAVSQAHPLQAPADAIRDREWNEATRALEQRRQKRKEERRALQANVAQKRAAEIHTLVQLRRLI